MPTIQRIKNLIIKIHTQDHEPPHVHIIAPDFSQVKVVIGTGEITKRLGSLNKAAEALAVKWVEENRGFLLEEWKRLVG
jgi:hypothetical protein